MKRDRRDAEFSKFIRERDHYTCQRCFKAYPPGHRGLHCAHLVAGRGKLATRWDPDNAVAWCYGCHRHMDTNPDLKRAWAIGYLGQEKYDEVLRRSNMTRKDLERA